MLPDGAGHIQVQVQIGTDKRMMLIDTGGAVSTINASVVSQLGLTSATAVYDREVDFEGRVIRDFVTIPLLTLGFAQFTDSRFAVEPDGDGLTTGTSAVGSLGPDKLARFDLDFDFGHSKFQLFRQNPCASSDVYWTPHAVVVPFTFDTSGHMVFDATLDGKPIRATFDTGAPITTMTLPAAKRLFGIDPEAQGLKPVGKMAGSEHQSVYSYKFKSLSIDDFELKDPTIALTPDAMANEIAGDDGLPDVILGLNALVPLHIYIAYGQHSVFLTSSDGEFVAEDAFTAQEAKDPAATAEPTTAAPPKPAN
jgi:predicted aspartyl protease